MVLFKKKSQAWCGTELRWGITADDHSLHDFVVCCHEGTLGESPGANLPMSWMWFFVIRSMPFSPSVAIFQCTKDLGLLDKMGKLFLLILMFCQDRALYEDIIVQVNFVITAFAFTLMFFVPFVPLYFAFQARDKSSMHQKPIVSTEAKTKPINSARSWRKPVNSLPDQMRFWTKFIWLHTWRKCGVARTRGGCFLVFVSGFDNWVVRRPWWKRCKKSRNKRKTRQRYWGKCARTSIMVYIEWWSTERPDGSCMQLHSE